VDVVKVSKTRQMVKLSEQKLLTGNIYKIIETERPDEYAFGCGNGMFFASFDGERFKAGKDSIFKGKYVTQICIISKGSYCVSVWN